MLTFRSLISSYGVFLYNHQIHKNQAWRQEFLSAVTVILKSFPFLHAGLLSVPVCLIAFS